MIAGREALLVFLVSLCPVLVSCSCASDFCVPPNVNRTETLKEALVYSRSQVYSGVVLGATCSCFNGDSAMDCRRYSYTEESGIYTVDVINRVVGIDARNLHFNFYFKTCTEAERNCLAVGENIRRGPEPENTNASSAHPYAVPVCHFETNDVCMYLIRVTEVFVGTYTVGEVVNSSGPYVNLCGQLGRILQLNEEYVAGVGSSCSNAFRSWSPLSDFTEDDLNFLRGTLNDDYDKSGDKTRDGDSLMKNETFVGGGNNETSINESATVYSSAAAIILLTVTGIALM